MFDTVIVITDRRVLDKQIRNTIKQLEQVKGVVNPVDKTSQQLKEYLEKGKSIIVTTIQKFPVISEEISKLKSKTFAVIIDEVHSSQSGETAKHLKKSLSKSILEDFQEGENRDDLTEVDKLILDEIIARGKQPHISYFGFSGTPKNKTLELFGRKNEEGQYVPFDLYSMRQSIAEGFTLDVLQNYTTYKRYFRLNKEIKEDKLLPQSRVKKLLVKWVDIQPHTIKEKTSIILEHFRDHTSKTIEGRGRGMLVTRSRLHCVKYKLEFDKQMKEMELPYRCLVAFSGTVYDKDNHQEYSEASLNGFPEAQTAEKFKDPNYRILIVNNKFQTGFDEPLLHTMYVDKRLSGLQCVQTLSRLNRTTRGKTDTFVLDFVNEPDTIKEAFQPYFLGTLLTEETDPQKLYQIQKDIENYYLFTDDDINRFIDIFYDERIPQEELQGIMDKTVEEWKKLEEDEREDFRHKIQSFIRLYGYVSQIISFTDINLEKLYIFLRFLNKKLPKRKIPKLGDIVSAVDLEYFRIEKKYEKIHIELENEYGHTDPISLEVGEATKEEKSDLLSNIIKTLNETFGSDLTEEDKIRVEKVKNKIFESEELRKVYMSDNSEANKKYYFNKLLDELIQGIVDESVDFYNKITEPNRNKYIKKVLFEHYANQFR